MTTSNADRKNRLRLFQWGFHGAAALALLLAGAAYYALVAGPLAAGRQQRLADIERLEAVHRAAANAAKTQAELQAALSQWKLREAALHARIPHRADEHEFLHAVTRAAQQAGLKIVDYRREGVADEKTHSTLRIGLKCRGPHCALCEVLDHMQKLERLIIIEHLGVTSDLASDDQAVEMTIVLFYGLKALAAAQEGLADA